MPTSTCAATRSPGCRPDTVRSAAIRAARPDVIVLQKFDHDLKGRALDAFGEQIAWHTMGEGFTWETQDKARDIAAATRAFDKAKELMADESIRLLVLDELNIVLADDTLPFAEALAFLKERPLTKHVCVTGRGARPELVAIADLVPSSAR